MTNDRNHPLSHRPMSVRLADAEGLVCPFCFNDRKSPRPDHAEMTFYTTWQGFELVSTGPYEWCAVRCCNCRAQGPSAGNQYRAIDAWRDHYRYSLDLLIGYCQARDYGVDVHFDPDEGIFRITATMVWAWPAGSRPNQAITVEGRGALRSAVYDVWEALGEYQAQAGDPAAQEVELLRAGVEPAEARAQADKARGIEE